MSMQAFKKVSDSKNKHELKGYSEVLARTQEHAKLNQGMYQAQIVAKCTDIEIEEGCELSTMVYFATDEVRELSRLEKVRELQEQGYQELTAELMENAIKHNKKLDIIETAPDLFARNGKYKPVQGSEGLALMPARNRTRGIYLSYMLINKPMAKII